MLHYIINNIIIKEDNIGFHKVISSTTRLYKVLVMFYIRDIHNFMLIKSIMYIIIRFK